MNDKSFKIGSCFSITLYVGGKSFKNVFERFLTIKL